MIIQNVKTFLIDGVLHYIDPDGNPVPIAAQAPVYEYANISREVTWRLRGTDERPDLANGTLIANIVKVGSKWKIQIALTIGSESSVPTADGWIFTVSPELFPAGWVTTYKLGGFGLASMDSRDDGSNAGPYWGFAKWKKIKVDGAEQPVIAVYCSKTSRSPQLEVINGVTPFNWFSAAEGGSVLALGIEYEGNAYA